MKVLRINDQVQTLKIIPRQYVSSVDISLVDKETNVEVTMTGIECDNSNGYLNIDSVFELTEGRFYKLTVSNEDFGVIYKDNVFGTNQEDLGLGYVLPDVTYVESPNPNNNIIYI